uniref:glucan endo-1,3-beta-D-glucosidase n=1 Tax=Araucaria cunninghamii TaxID=56994 RepID=A0A0D6QTA6_ARACU
MQSTTMHALSSPFPGVNNTAAPDPQPYFAENLMTRPLPTNSAWQNYVLKNGNQPEYIHPYLVRSEGGALTVCYPARVVHPAFIFQAFVANLIISCAQSGTHTISRFDDLSVTLSLPGPMEVPLVRGSPYITCIIKGGQLRLSTIHAVLGVEASNDSTKHTVRFNNGQTWLLYTSAPLGLDQNLTVTGEFQGVLRIALLSDMFDQVAADKERALDQFNTAYPIAGRADLSAPFRVCYEWKKKGRGQLLMLSHPVHRQIMTLPRAEAVVRALSYRSMDGELLGTVGCLWFLDEIPISVSWYSAKGLEDGEEIQNLISALEQDVADLKPINNTSTYFYGKAVARAARLALIAEEAHCQSVIPRIREFLEQSINPWLDGSFQGNGLVYDGKWGGLISKDGARDAGADFGLGVYNDHHYHFGYFCYGMAVLAKLDHSWARKFKPQVYSIVKDFMTVDSEKEVLYPRLRNFDLWKLHSWAGGLTEFADGRNQESTSEALNAYYSAALLGLVYGDTHLVSTGSTLAALEMRSAKAWWHVPLNSTTYESEFVKENRVVGVLWSTKRDSGLWFAPADWRECRLGIQVLPILPITELLFSDVGFAKELVEWTAPALGREGVGEGWKGFVYALESLYDKDSALQKTMALKGYDDGNSLSNLLWWIYTRGNKCRKLFVPENCFPVPIEEDMPHNFYQQFLSFKESTQDELQRLAAEIKELKKHGHYTV